MKKSHLERMEEFLACTALLGLVLGVICGILAVFFKLIQLPLDLTDGLIYLHIFSISTFLISCVLAKCLPDD